jgi:phosphatidylinositol-3-phosphatase
LKAYMQSMPSVGFTGEYSPVDTVSGQQVPRKLYAQKHNPFFQF